MPLILGIIICVVSTYVYINWYNSDIVETVLLWISVLSVLTFGVSMLVWGSNALSTYSLDARRDAIVYSIETLQTDGTFEHLSLDEEVINFNKVLSSYKKWNDTWMFGFSINDQVDTLEYISVERGK